MSVNAIAWIVSIAFIVILVGGFFIGFWRGLKKSSLNLVVSLVGAIISFFCTPSITKLIMGININTSTGPTKLEYLLVELIRGNKEDVSKFFENNPNLELFIQKLPSAICNTLVFILFTIILEILIYSVYKIIALIFFKKQKGEKVHRISGGVVGLAKTFIITVFAFMPLASLVGVFNNITYSDNYYVEEKTVDNNSYGVIGDMLPSAVVKTAKGMERSFLVKVCGVFGLDDAMFDYYSNFEVGKEKIYIRREVERYYDVVDFGYQMKTSESVEFKKLDYDKLEKMTKDIENGGLFKSVICQTLADVIVNYKEYSFLTFENKDYDDVLASIGKGLSNVPKDSLYTYFSNDIDEAFDIFKTLGKSGILDLVLNLESKDVKNILNILVDSENLLNYQASVKNLFEVNLVKDGAVPLLSKVISEVFKDVENIDVDTSSWTTDDWEKTSQDIVSASKNISSLLNALDDINNIYNIETLLEGDYDLESVLGNIGSLLDTLTSMKLLKNNNVSIFNSLLEKNKILIPEGEVFYTEKGEEKSKTITKYEELFDFISSPIVRIKESNIYDILTNSQNSNDVIINLAKEISKEGNENLLSEILLPLEQITLTKEKIFDEKLNTLNNSVVNFSLLDGYTDWSNDLGYISNLLIELNKLTVGEVEEKTYLELALNGNFDEILNNLQENDVEKILKPILYAKSTEGLKVNLMTSIKNVFDALTDPAMSNIDITKATLVSGNSEDQAQEIINVFKAFEKLNASLENEKVEDKSIVDLDKTILGQLLSAMKENAYRVELSAKQEKGIFNGVFINLVNKIKIDYSDAIKYIENEKGEGYLDQDNYKNIDFVEIMNLISEFESLKG